jgi:hypothetical protein
MFKGKAELVEPREEHSGCHIHRDLPERWHGEDEGRPQGTNRRALCRLYLRVQLNSSFFAIEAWPTPLMDCARRRK